jgi:hypothetical protein
MHAKKQESTTHAQVNRNEATQQYRQNLSDEVKQQAQWSILSTADRV